MIMNLKTKNEKKVQLLSRTSACYKFSSCTALIDYKG